MRPTSDESNDLRVLVLAPRGRNAELIERFLSEAGIHAAVCRDVDEFRHSLDAGAAGAIVTEEAFTRAGIACLLETLERQPPWSEMPLIILTGGGATTRGSAEVAGRLSPRTSVTLLERPVRALTLVSAARSMLRSRGRQYEIRDLIASERQARAEAETANRAKDHFLAALSHELRTPLNPVLLALSLIERDAGMSADSRELLQTIRRNVALETKLIDDLLDITRIARGKVELRQEAVDMHRLIEHAVHICDDDATTSRRVKLKLEAEDHVVWGDSARLSQVLWNLIKNALKFTPLEGEVTISTSRDENGLLSVSVADTGVGIEPDALARIFSAFEQEDRSVTRRFGGLGLGLAICKALVEMHGGTIEARSEGKGRGASFTFRLRTVGDKGAPAAPASSNLSSGANGSKRAVLLVEDHAETARLLSIVLKRLNYDVVLAHDCASALDAARSRRFELVLSDIGLPDGTGHDLMRSLRKDHPISGIAVSGYGLEEDRRRSLEAGFAEHLVKPVEIDKLLEAVARVSKTNGRANGR